MPLSKVPPNIVKEIFDTHKSKEMIKSKSTLGRKMSRKWSSSCNGCEAIEMTTLQCTGQESLGEVSSSCSQTSTSGTMTTSFSLSGFNTYLSEQQLRAARMSNTVTVMAPCLRQPITTTTPASDLPHLRCWAHCCSTTGSKHYLRSGTPSGIIESLGKLHHISLGGYRQHSIINGLFKKKPLLLITIELGFIFNNI